MYPDPSIERDSILANTLYKDLQAVDPHTEIQREQYEARWFEDTKHEERILQRVKNNIANDMKLMKSASNRCEKRYAEAGYQWSFMDYPIEQRIRAPTAEHMHLSRFSISLRYAAILFTALSHLARERRLPPLLGYSESLYALAIYSVFNRFRYIIDARGRRTMKEWSRTIDTRIKHGYNAALR